MVSSRGCHPLRQTSIGADLSELQGERLYRTLEVDDFAHMEGAVSSFFLLSKCVRWSI